MTPHTRGQTQPAEGQPGHKLHAAVSTNQRTVFVSCNGCLTNQNSAPVLGRCCRYEMTEVSTVVMMLQQQLLSFLQTLIHHSLTRSLTKLLPNFFSPTHNSHSFLLTTDSASNNKHPAFITSQNTPVTKTILSLKH